MFGKFKGHIEGMEPPIQKKYYNHFLNQIIGDQENCFPMN